MCPSSCEPPLLMALNSRVTKSPRSCVAKSDTLYMQALLIIGSALSTVVPFLSSLLQLFLKLQGDRRPGVKGYMIFFLLSKVTALIHVKSLFLLKQRFFLHWSCFVPIEGVVIWTARTSQQYLNAYCLIKKSTNTSV